MRRVKMITLQDRLTLEDRYGYTVDEEGYLINAPCGCYGCDSGRMPGHFACEAPTPELLTLEEAGVIERRLLFNLDSATVDELLTLEEAGVIERRLSMSGWRWIVIK
jgi:hypothetical protein